MNEFLQMVVQAEMKPAEDNNGSKNSNSTTLTIADFKYEPPAHPYDPRPDFIRDHRAWFFLLTTAYLRDPNGFYPALLFMRAMGTGIIKNPKSPAGGLSLRPFIDTTGVNAWRSAEEYNRMRDRILEPFTAELIQALSDIAS